MEIIASGLLTRQFVASSGSLSAKGEEVELPNLAWWLPSWDQSAKLAWKYN